MYKFLGRLGSAVTGEKGFSLAELAIGLVILAILVGVVIMAGMQSVKNSKTVAAADQLESVQASVVSYVATQGVYPATLTSPAIVKYLPTAPDITKYAYTCDSSLGSYLVYTASDSTENAAVLAAWTKRLGTGAIGSGLAVMGMFQAGPITCG